MIVIDLWMIIDLMIIDWEWLMFMIIVMVIIVVMIVRIMLWETDSFPCLV